jgi:hypothetical protein
MGLPDRYADIVDPFVVERITGIVPGYEGNVMAEFGGIPWASDITHILLQNCYPGGNLP